ncbi:MAG TPA: hypothetical protein PK812_10510 [Beijerinckiaceae bacterium]|nr:hypothetical protein [Beijerinckiaceae bacterium]
MLDLWKDPWPLDVKQCPCDIHFTDWLASAGVRNATIFHFGTGDHHHVGKTEAMREAGNSVLGITATKPEYDSYIDLVIRHPLVGKRYKVLFTDIYQLAPELMPEFDVVTLFHLCEFWSETNAPYARMNDSGVLEAMAGKVKRGGKLLFYTGSFAASTASKLVDANIARLGFGPAERHETLLVHTKR